MLQHFGLIFLGVGMLVLIYRGVSSVEARATHGAAQLDAEEAAGERPGPLIPLLAAGLAVLGVVLLFLGG
jgi:hypothetical protein